MGSSWRGLRPGRRSSTTPKRICSWDGFPERGAFQGELADVRLYNRPLEEAEIAALVEPGKQFVKDTAGKKQGIKLTLGGRQFSGVWQQPAFLAVRLEAGPLAIGVETSGARELERIVLTPLPATEMWRSVSWCLKSACRRSACISGCAGIAAARWLRSARRKPWRREALAICVRGGDPQFPQPVGREGQRELSRRACARSGCGANIRMAAICRVC